MPKNTRFDFDKEWDKAHEEMQPFVLIACGLILTGFCLLSLGHLLWST